MRFGIASGFLWGLDTVILGIALTMGAFIGTPEAIAFAAIASAFMHDAACAIWLFLYMGVRRRLGDTLRALKTRSGKVVMLGALLGGPLGMTGYLVAINNIGAGYTAIISAFYPAFGTFMAFVLLKERMRPRQLVALACALAGVMVMGYATSGDSSVGNAALGLVGAVVCVVGWGSEAVLCAWGMRDDAVDNETALQIRETTSAIVYAVVVLSGLAGAASYLFYYKGIATIGAARCMALNITYSAWAVVFGLVLLGSVPTVVQIVCCLVIMAGTVLAACDWDELFGRKKTPLPEDAS